jgi:hypothetical protein
MVDMEMKMLSDVQFLHLARYPNGRLVGLYDIFLQLTAEQVEMLHGDDWSYYNELREELDYLMAEAA